MDDLGKRIRRRLEEIEPSATALEDTLVRVRRRRFRNRVGIVVMSLVLAAGGVALAARTFRPPVVPSSPGPSPSPSADDPALATRIPGAFYPPMSREGDRIVMPVTFIDGTTAEVVFGDGLAPETLGVYGEIAGGLGRVDRPVYFRYRDGSSFMGSGPLQTYEGHGGTAVEEWQPLPEVFPAPCTHLVFRFGNWFVGVPTCRPQLSSEEKAEWARRVVGRETDGGFLLLSAVAPLQIAQAGESDGPQLWLQGPDHGSPFITLTPLLCDPDQPASADDVRVTADGQRVSFTRIGDVWYAGWCEDSTMQVQVESPDRGYVEAAAESLRIRGVPPAEISPPE